MIRLMIAALLTQAAAPQDTAPQTAAPTDALFAAIDALPVDTMCSTRGAYQYEWAATNLPPSPFAMPGMNRIGLPPSAAPFQRVALDASKWSNRFYRADYEFPIASRPDALAIVQRIAGHFRKRGWIEKPGVAEPGGSMIDMEPGLGEVNFYSAASAMDGDKRSGVRVALSYTMGAVHFECTDMAGMIVHAGEAFGDLPDGIARPQPPVTPPPAALDPVACTTPAGLAAVDAIAGGEPDAMMRYVGERVRYHERIVTWKNDRLKKSGKVSAARLSAITMAGLVRGSADGNPMAAITPVLAMFDHAAEVGRLKQAGDAPGACRAAVKLLRGFGTIDAVTTKQWRAMEAAIDTEAARVGVSLD